MQPGTSSPILRPHRQQFFQVAPEHDERYAVAEEFVDVVRGLWDSWDDDAIIKDKQSGIYADPQKMHILDHKGKYFSVKGPLNIPRSPQGHPILIQAGSSGPARIWRHARPISSSPRSRALRRRRPSTRA